MTKDFLDIAKVYTVLSNILEDRMEFLKNEKDEVKKLAENIQYTIIYTGSNVLKLYGFIDRKVKDHDVVIKVYSSKSVEIINLIFRRWYERFSTENMYTFDIYGNMCFDHFALKLNCDLHVDIFVTVNSDENYLELPNPNDLNKTTIKLGLVDGIFKSKLRFDSRKAMIDAMEMTVKLIRNADEKKEKKNDVEPESPF